MVGSMFHVWWFVWCKPPPRRRSEVLCFVWWGALWPLMAFYTALFNGDSQFNVEFVGFPNFNQLTLPSVMSLEQLFFPILIIMASAALVLYRLHTQRVAVA